MLNLCPKKKRKYRLAWDCTYPTMEYVTPKKGGLRGVFDCSASYQGRFLNNNLLNGPNLTNSLIGVLLRFCHGNVALLADVEKMYYQVKMPPQHVDFLHYGGKMETHLRLLRNTGCPFTTLDQHHQQVVQVMP